MKVITKRLGAWVVVAGLILLIPLVAMQFTEAVVWNRFDFIVAFVLLTGAAFAFEALSSLVHSRRQRILIGLGTFLLLVLVWAELAVGIFGTLWAGS